MKVAQYRCYVVKLPDTCHNACRRILDRLKLFQQTVTDAVLLLVIINQALI